MLLLPLLLLLLLLRPGHAGAVPNFVRCEGVGATLGDFSVSDDGVTWDNIPDPVFIDGTTDGACRDVCYSPDLDMWVATGLRGDQKRFASSANGFVWILSTDTFGGNDGRTCAWGRDKFVVGGGFAGPPNVAFSFNGATWATALTGTNGGFAFHGIAYSNQQMLWVGVGESGAAGQITLSTDGMVWTTPIGLGATRYVADVAWSNFLSTWAFVAKTGTDAVFFSSPAPLTSINTAAGVIPNTSPSEQALAALDSGGFVCLAGTLNQVWSSSTGSNWALAGVLGPESTDGRGICALNAGVVAMGFNLTSLAGNVYVSTNAGRTFGPVFTAGNLVNSNLGSITSRVTNVAGAVFTAGAFLVPAQSSATISSPFAFVDTITVLGNLTFVGNAFLTVNQSLVCGTSSLLTLLVQGPGTVSVASFRAVSGRFASIVATDAASTCYTTDPVYTATTLTVTVSPCVGGGGLSQGAMIGVIVGAAVGGVLLAVAVIVTAVVLRNRYDASANHRIRLQSWEGAQSAYRRF